MAQERGRKKGRKISREQAGRKGNQTRPKSHNLNPDFSRTMADMDTEEMPVEEEFLGRKGGEARDKSEKMKEER